MMPAMPDIAFVSSAAQQIMNQVAPILMNARQDLEGQKVSIKITIRSIREES